MCSSTYLFTFLTQYIDLILFWIFFLLLKLSFKEGVDFLCAIIMGLEVRTLGKSMFLSFEQKLIHLPSTLTDCQTDSSVRIMLLETWPRLKNLKLPKLLPDFSQQVNLPPLLGGNNLRILHRRILGLQQQV